MGQLFFLYIWNFKYTIKSSLLFITPSFTMLHFPQHFNISEFIYVTIYKFGTMYWNTYFYKILKILYDMFFGLLHAHVNKTNQVKFVLYVCIFGKGLYE